MKKFLCVAVLFVIFFGTAKFTKAGELSLEQGVRRAADLQLSREGTYPNGDTGIGVYSCAWQWEIAPGLPAYKNTQSPSVLGLLEAYEALGKAKYVGDATKGAICSANQLMGRLDASTSRPFSMDVVFLVELSEVTRNSVYRNRAGVYHERIRAAYPTGAVLADHYIDIRLSLSGWDLSSQIKAARAVGQDEYADQIVSELIARRADWEGWLYGGYDYTLISHAGLINALSDNKNSGVKSYRKEIADLVLYVQESDGSWGDGDYQTTAFALMGLETLSRGRDVRHAIKGGMNYLLSTETLDGGWSYPPENAEVNGEVLSALAPLLRNRGDDEDDRGFEKPKEHNNYREHVRPHRDDK